MPFRHAQGLHAFLHQVPATPHPEPAPRLDGADHHLENKFPYTKDLTSVGDFPTLSPELHMLRIAARAAHREIPMSLLTAPASPDQRVCELDA